MSIDVPRLTAALEGRYTIERELGEGGMAIVYLADDLKHDRKVALKVLKPELASVVGGERFISEIRTTANLQHPHILPLFDSGEADSFLFYVMPYVEGETLRDRLDREKQLPVTEAVAIARKVAGALQAAHDQGVIHRDIKPANILMQKGEPVVSDFGIALAVAEAGGGRLTETGLSLGTPYYMAPEQATGDRDPDARSDLYSLASVLYEMLAGEPPFTGGTAQAVLGRILTSDPTPINETRRAVSPDLDAVVLHALEKTPADRFPSMTAWADALGRVDLEWSGSHTAATASSRRAAGSGSARSGSGAGWKAATGVLALATMALVGLQLVGSEDQVSDEVLRYEMLLPVEIGANSDWGSNVAISPDGRAVVYSGMDDGAESPGLSVRMADQLESTPLSGTSLGVHPTFSPDGSRVAFISDDRALKVASLEGRPPITLHADGLLRRTGLSWGEDGYIYFGQQDRPAGVTGLYRIPEGGGDIENLTRPDTTRREQAHYFPVRIPDSELVLFTVALGELYNASTREIAILDLSSGEVTVLVEGMQATWSETGHILVVSDEGVLQAAPLDRKSGDLGPLVPVFEGIQVESLGSADLSISSSGDLVYVPGQSLFGSTPVWVDRAGLDVPVDPGWSGELTTDVRISPDGTRVAFTTNDDRGLQVWTKELDRGPEASLSLEGTRNVRPTWTNDGTSLAFVSNRSGYNEIFTRVADASRPADRFVEGNDLEGLDQAEISPDNRWVVLQSNDDIYIRANDPGSELMPLLAEPGTIEGNFQISPDGRWIAYNSTESGETMVYVRPFPNVEGARTPISDSPARDPVWAPDMSELYYRTLDGDFVAAAITSDQRLAVRSRTVLFPYRGFLIDGAYRQYDVHPDGDRFLMIRLGDRAGRTPVVVVRGFANELQSGTDD
ncbi:MAG TPA: protein kinase [Longimicrobiales bacterium]|nr:protein kinase [Longimicrobiales bacterium]